MTDPTRSSRIYHFSPLLVSSARPSPPIMSKFSRLVRFLATDGKIYYGDATDPGIPSSARVITGDVFGSYSIGESTPIRTLLCPIDPSHVRTVRGIGLNYRKHAEETGLPIPKHPILFHKPVTSLAGPLDPIYIPKGLQAHNASDYECELVIVMGKMAKDVKRHEAMQYILGFTVGNDVSQREWQMSLGGTQ